MNNLTHGKLNNMIENIRQMKDNVELTEWLDTLSDKGIIPELNLGEQLILKACIYQDEELFNDIMVEYDNDIINEPYIDFRRKFIEDTIRMDIKDGLINTEIEDFDNLVDELYDDKLWQDFDSSFDRVYESFNTEREDGVIDE